MSDLKSVTKLARLQKAYEGAYYTIVGAGGDLAEWVAGYEKWLAEEEIGKPTKWFQTTGAAVNLFVGHMEYPLDLTVLMFPLDGLDLGKLAIFKLAHEDRWFNDIVDNMRRV